MITRADIVTAAKDWIGVRWKHQACVPGVACDCIGLVVGVAKQCGIAGADTWLADPMVKGYGRQPDPAALLEACARYLDPAPIAAPGDVLVMRFEREPQHFGILSAPGRMIHAYAQVRRVVEHGIDDLWRSRIIGSYAFRGVD